jgi:GntR family transcriptional regulator/MocR family aminotransferase
MGFAIAPTPLVPALAAARSIADSHGPIEVQRALATLIDGGTFARHVRRVLRVYRERRARLIEGLASIDALDIVPSAAGLHIAAMLHDARRDGDAIVAALRERGVGVQSLREHYATQPRAGFAFGFGLVATNQISEGVARIAKALSATPVAIGESRRRRRRE